MDSPQNKLTIDQIRLANARKLLEEVDGQKGMIEKTGRSQSQISQIMGENPLKPIGKGIARSLEKAFKKPVGWMDTIHDNRPADRNQPLTDQEKELLELCDQLTDGERISLMNLMQSMLKK